MAEKFGVFDESGGSPEYNAALFSSFMDLLSTGVIPDYENELEVTTGTGLQVKVDSGGAIRNGRFYIQDEAASGGTPFTLSIDAASSGYLRKDRIAVKWDFSTPSAPTTTCVVVKGTEAVSSPTAPTLTESSTVLYQSLGVVNIDYNTISSIEDDRTITGARHQPADDSITVEKIEDLSASKAVSTNANGKLSVSAATSTEQGYLSGVTSAIQTQLDGKRTLTTVQVVTGTTGYTLDINDANTVQYRTYNAFITVTVPPNSSVAFPVGTRIEFVNGSTPSGGYVWSAGSGVTILSVGSSLSNGTGIDGAYCELIKLATDTWVLQGDLA